MDVMTAENMPPTKDNVMETIRYCMRAQDKQKALFKRLVDSQQAEFASKTPRIAELSRLEDKITYVQDTLDAIHCRLLQCRSIIVRS